MSNCVLKIQRHGPKAYHSSLCSAMVQKANLYSFFLYHEMAALSMQIWQMEKGPCCDVSDSRLTRIQQQRQAWMCRQKQQPHSQFSLNPVLGATDAGAWSPMFVNGCCWPYLLYGQMSFQKNQWLYTLFSVTAVRSLSLFPSESSFYQLWKTAKFVI